MKLLKNLLLSALMLWGGVCATYAQEKTMTAGVPVVKLNNGVEMPRFGLGTFLQPSDEVCEQSCLTALKADYRHIDTAHAYQDEAGVGHAVKESGNKEDSRSPRQDPGAGHPALAHPGRLLRHPRCIESRLHQGEHPNLRLPVDRRRDAADALAQQGEAFLQRHAGRCGEDGLGGQDCRSVFDKHFQSESFKDVLSNPVGANRAVGNFPAGDFAPIVCFLLSSQIN